MHLLLQFIKAAPAAAACLLVTLASSSPAAPAHTIEEEVLNARIGKWQLMSLRWITHPPHEGGSLVLDLVEGTRDRDGQGVYTGAMFRILHASEDQVTVRNRDANVLVIDIAYEGTSGPSSIQLSARMSGAGDERHAKLSIRGHGPVYKYLQAELAQRFEHADWVKSLDDAKWDYQPPQEGTTMPLAGGSTRRLDPPPGSGIERGSGPNSITVPKAKPVPVPAPKQGPKR